MAFSPAYRDTKEAYRKREAVSEGDAVNDPGTEEKRVVGMGTRQGFYNLLLKEGRSAGEERTMGSRK